MEKRLVELVKKNKIRKLFKISSFNFFFRYNSCILRKKVVICVYEKLEIIKVV